MVSSRVVTASYEPTIGTGKIVTAAVQAQEVHTSNYLSKAVSSAVEVSLHRTGPNWLLYRGPAHHGHRTQPALPDVRWFSRW